MGNAGFKVVQHNARGLCVSDIAARQLAGTILRSLANQAQFLCISEVHGHRSEILSQLRLWLPGWKCFASSFFRSDGSENYGAGGVFIAVSPVVATRAISYTPHILVPGRCMGLSIKFPGMVFDLVNIHNYGLTKNQVLQVGLHLDALQSRDRAHPTACSSLAVGDLNFLADGEQRFKVGRPLAPSSLWRSHHSGTHSSLWKSFLSKWTELAQPFPTHFSSESCSSSRLDRGWSSSPVNQILNFRVSSSTVGTPEEFESARLSDHCPVAYCFSPWLPTGGTSFSIPRKVCMDPFFFRKCGQFISRY